MADELGVSRYETMWTQPTTDAEIVMAALRCGQTLLHAFTEARWWPRFPNGLSKREARKAAKYMTRVFPTDSGRDAVSLMAQQFGWVMGATWSDAADAVEDREEADSLLKSALLSIGVAKLVETVWPVHGYEAPLTAVEMSKPVTYEVDNPDALVDLRLYLRRMIAYASALGVAMWERFDEFEQAILTPIWVFDAGYGTVTSASWTYVAGLWAKPSVAYERKITQAGEDAPSA
jgi:hypothetical protein